MRGVLKFVRPKIMRTCITIAVLGGLSAGKLSWKIAIVPVVLVLWYIHAASSNDYADRKIDEINLQDASDRPLITHTITPTMLWTAHYAAGIGALILSSIYGVYAFALAVVVLAFDYMYSFKPFRLTDRGALAQFFLPLAYVIFPFSLGYWSGSNTAAYPWLLVSGLYCGFIGRLFLKDFRDVKGDSAYGKRTFLIRHGVARTCQASWFFSMVSLCLISAAVKYSIGVQTILIIGQIWASRVLVRLARSHVVDRQLRLIGRLAQIANIAVVSVVVYCGCITYAAQHTVVVWLPFVVGAALMVVVWKSGRNVHKRT